MVSIHQGRWRFATLRERAKKAEVDSGNRDGVPSEVTKG